MRGTLHVSGLHVDASASAEQPRQLHSALQVETTVSKLAPPGSWRALVGSQPDHLRVRSYGGRVSSCRALHVHCSSTQPRRLKPVGSRDGRRVLVDLATREQHADSPRCHEPFLSQTQATVCLRLAEEGCIFVRESNLELPGWISSLCVPDT